MPDVRARAGNRTTRDTFNASVPVRRSAEVREGRRVKPSLCPSLAVLDAIKGDPGIKRLLFCGVGCSVSALRSLNGSDPEGALGLDALYVLGTHCVDNSPTPEAARTFVAAIPGVGQDRADDVEAYEFMADFRVHARLQGGETVKQAYMALPPNLGIPSIADSCFSCFDYTNGLADVVVGYMGAPFDRGGPARDPKALQTGQRSVRNRGSTDSRFDERERDF